MNERLNNTHWDELVLIAVECDNPRIWLSVCKSFWDNNILLEKLSDVKSLTKPDRDYYYGSILPCGMFYDDHHISIFSATDENKQTEIYTAGVDIVTRKMKDVTVYILNKKRVNTKKFPGRIICYKPCYSYLKTDVITHSTLVQNRTNIYQRITGNHSSNYVKRISIEYFEKQLLDKSLLDTYLICIMNARLLGVKVELDVDVNSIKSTDIREIDNELKLIESQLNRKVVNDLIAEIKRRL